MPELQTGRIDERRGSTSSVERPGKRQRAGGNLLPEVGAWLKKEKLNRSSRTEGWSGELTGSEEALWSEDGRTGTKECSVRCNPYGFKASTEFNRVLPADVSEVLLGFELRLFVIGNAAGESAAHQRIRDVQCRLKARPCGREVENTSSIGE